MTDEERITKARVDVATCELYPGSPTGRIKAPPELCALVHALDASEEALKKAEARGNASRKACEGRDEMIGEAGARADNERNRAEKAEAQRDRMRTLLADVLTETKPLGVNIICFPAWQAARAALAEVEAE